MRFEWDDEKAKLNKRKHGVSFDEAVTIFQDPLTLIASDSVHGDRFTILGLSLRMRLLIVIYAEKHHGETIRIISARRATQAERKAYEGI